MKYFFYSFLLVGIFITAPLHAYLFSFSNHTNEELKIRIFLAADTKWYEAIIASKNEGHERAMHTFRFGADQGYKIGEAEWWKGINCLHELQIQTPLMKKEEQIDDMGDLKVTYVRAIDPVTKKPMWNPWRNLEVLHIKDEAYNEMVAAGSMLGDGLVDAAATAATLATGVPMPAFKVSGIVKGAGTLAAYSKCKNVHFDLIPTADSKKQSEIFYVVAMTIAR